MSSIFKSRQHRLTGFLWMTILGGVALLVGAFAQLGSSPIYGDHPWPVLVFTVLLFAAELKAMPSLTDDTELTASWAFAFTLLLIAPLAGAVTAVAIAPMARDIHGRKPINRLLFNSSQFALSLAGGGIAGSLVDDLSLVADGNPVTLRWLLAVTVACGTGFTLNTIFISVAVALHQNFPVLEMLRRSFEINLSMDGLLLALAPIFVVVGLEALVLVPLLLLTVWFIFRSAAIALRNKHEATHDQLTGIPNRRMFEDHVAMLIEGSQSNDERFALVQIDLDGFKGINDRLGHHYGDLVLKEIGSRLANGGRESDQAARLGGDEFALLFVDITDADEATKVAERVLENIGRPLDIEGVPLTIGASMGVAIYPDHAEDPQRLLHHADMAMYRAKQQGGGWKLFESSDDTVMPGRIALLGDLAGAMSSNQLTLEFQPKMNIESGEITAVEALVRWNHPVHGRVQPSWFMPQAEQTALISQLTDHILNLALGQARRWIDDDIHVRVAVNASARNLHDYRFPERVAALLARHGVDASCLEIEITENSVMEDPVRSAEVLSRLRSIGITLAIDDFGTGFSSLSSLRDLTIDRVKIDRSFISGMAHDPGDLTIARSVIELAHNLSLHTVAEGVEDMAVLELLRDLGCDEIQGYLLSRPVAATELEPMLRAGRADLTATRPTTPTIAS